MANPPPTYQSGLVLAELHLLHVSSSRECLLTTAHGSDMTHTADQDAQTVFTGWHQLLPQLDSGVAMTQVTIRRGDGSATPQLGVSTGATVNGGAASSSQPPNCNLLVKKSTGLAGRKNRGRTYVPWCIDEVNCDELGVVNPASVAGIQPLFDSVLAGWAGGSMSLIIGNRTITTPLPPGKPYVSHYAQGPVVTSWRVEPVIASQRRRIGR